MLLHCTLQYPCPPEGINLRMMEHLMRAFPEVPVGLSDHSLGISVPQAAVALGACIVEKHYTVDKTLPGSPDHHLSVDPPEMKAMVAGIRTVEKALGKAQKGLEPLEKDAYLYARRSVTSQVAIPRGTAITRAMLTYKRPGTGIGAKHLDLVVGPRGARRHPRRHHPHLGDGLRDGLRVVAIVPARGGTDPVPYLNIKRLGDCPLLAHTLDAAQAAPLRRPRGGHHRRPAGGRGGEEPTAPRSPSSARPTSPPTCRA